MKRKNGEKQPTAINHFFRLNVVYAMVFLSFSGLVLRAAYVQIVRGAAFRNAQFQTEVATTPILPQRGWIYDANGQVLAADVPAISIVLNKMASTTTEDYRRMASELAPILKVSETKLYQQMTATPSSHVTLLADANSKQVAYIKENQSQFPNVDIQNHYRRVYPNGDLAGQVLGYISKGGLPSNYARMGYDSVGATGLEAQYESRLRGIPGARQMEVNAAGEPTHKIGSTPAIAGDNLQLALDGHMQATAQMIIQNYIDASKYKSQIKDAAAVMLNVKTGGVIAMVSYPYLDPNWYASGTGYMKHVRYLQNSGAQQNFAIQNPQYPGSTVKPANLITALQQRVITPNYVMIDHQKTRIGTTVKDDDGMNHGFVSPVRALAVSCDTFFYEVGLWLGKWVGSSATSGGAYPAKDGNYQHYLNTDYIKGLNKLYQGEWAFGLGPKTGVDLPAEQAGKFYISTNEHSSAYYATVYDLQKSVTAIKQHGAYANHGTPVDLAMAAIGQEQQFTPMQLGEYVMTLANQGKQLQPHLLDKVYAPTATPGGSTKPIQQFKTKVVSQVHASPAYFQVVKAGMHQVTTGSDATAAGVFANAHYAVAAKTGTAQLNLHGLDNAVFICYAPLNHPLVAVAVMIPGGGYGASAAGVVARRLLDAYFNEHHEPFMPKKGWTNAKIPANWKASPAYRVPENSK